MENSDTYFLLKALKEGNLVALEKIYKIYYSKLYWFSKKFNSITLEPDDFVQETFIKLWKKKELLDENVLLDKQIFVICKHLIINHLKREMKSSSLPESGFYLESTMSDDYEEKNKNIARIYSLIKKLPKKRKEIFLMHKISNLTYQEISEFLGISKKTIAHQIYLASNYLKEECNK